MVAKTTIGKSKIFPTSQQQKQQQQQQQQQKQPADLGKLTSSCGKLSNYHDLTFHRMSLAELSGHFATSLSNGLAQTSAESLLSRHGPNQIKPRSKNALLQLVSYLFTGFCGLLWISSIVCLLAWKPIGSPPDPTNLGLAVLLVIVIFLQASFSAFQDWSSSKVMKSIKNLLPSEATVVRDGAEKNIQAEHLVVGDIIILSYGHKVVFFLPIYLCACCCLRTNKAQQKEKAKFFFL